MTAELRVEAPPSSTSRPLAWWIAGQVVVAAIVLLAVATTTSIQPAIALSWPGLRPDLAITAGLTFWLAFGLVGGVRTRLQPGGGVVTFSLPFVVAGAVLGGPLAGGLMGLVSELEVRELRTQPWYGILSNHAVGILAAVAAGTAAVVLRGLLTPLLPDQQALVFFAEVGVAALTFAVVNVALVIPTLAFRNDLTLSEASQAPDAAFRATTVAETILAWNLAVAYQLVGWWAPIAIVALVLSVWQAFDRGEDLRHDAMTGLLNDVGFAPHLGAAVRKAAAGKRPSAFLSLDLDGLWEVNNDYGSAAGDELLRAAARRMHRAVRATDFVCRKASTGDEFMVLLSDIANLASALRVAERIQASIREPIHLRGQGRSELVKGGIAIGLVLIERGTSMTPTSIADLGERRMKKSKVLDGEIVFAGDGPTEAELRANRKKKDETRSHGHSLIEDDPSVSPNDAPPPA